MIHLIRNRATGQQLREMLEKHKSFVKLAIDIRTGMVVGGGGLHADCEELLLNEGSKQEDIWGADWIPSRQEIEYGAMINIRPRQNNRTYVLTLPDVRKKIDEIVRPIFEGV